MTFFSSICRISERILLGRIKMKSSRILKAQRNLLFALIAAAIFMFAANGVTYAQEEFKVGDKVEVKDGDRWYKAQIVDTKPGEFKVHYDGYDPIFDVWVLPNRIRTIGGPDPATINRATKYKPGDRVECDKASMGIWEKGTVVPFLPDDTNKNSGNFYRVRLDSFNRWVV